MFDEEIIYRTIEPCPALASHIKCFWVLESPFPTGEETVVTDGCPEIILHYGDRFAEPSSDGSWEEQPAAIIAGQITRPLTLLATGKVGMLGIRFWPHGLAPLLNVPASELTDQRIDIEALNPTLTQLEELVSQKSTIEARVSACESFLKPALLSRDSDPVIDRAVMTIVSSNGNVMVRHLAKELNTTERQLQRKFHTHVGLSPRQLCRAFRFHRIFELLEEPPRPTWAQLALDCGFFDQAHLNRDFRQFTGQSPSAYIESPIAQFLSAE